jgi:hypothetical protein
MKSGKMHGKIYQMAKTEQQKELIMGSAAGTITPPLQASNVMEFYKAVISHATTSDDFLKETQVVYDQIRAAGSSPELLQDAIMRLCQFFSDSLSNIIRNKLVVVMTSPIVRKGVTTDETYFLVELFKNAQTEEDPDLIVAQLGATGEFLEQDMQLEEMYNEGLLDFESLATALQSPRRIAIYMNIFMRHLMNCVYDEPMMIHVQANIPETIQTSKTPLSYKEVN